MRPLAILLGIILATSVSITFVLVVVDFIYLVLRDDYPRLAGELPSLAIATVLFVILTAVAAGSFYAHVKQLAWRSWGYLGLVAMLLAVGLYFWPA